MNKKELREFIAGLEHIYPNKRKCLYYPICTLRELPRVICDGFGNVTHDSQDKSLGILNLKCRDYLNK